MQFAGGRVPDPHRPAVAAAGQPGAVRGDRHRPHPAGVAGESGTSPAGGRVPDPHRPPSAPLASQVRRGDRARSAPVAGSQIRTDPSPPPLASQVPSGATATAEHRVGMVGEGGAQLAGGRIPDPHRPRRRRWLARYRPGRSPPPSRRWRGRWSSRAGGARSLPVSGSQIRTDPSSPALASQVPSGVKATADIRRMCPVRAVSRWAAAGSQIRTDPSSRAAGQPGAVRGDRHRPHPAGVAGEGGAQLAGGRVPDPHRPVVAAAGQPGAVRGDRHRPHRAGVACVEGGALLAGGRVPDPHRPVVAAPLASQVPSGAIATALTSRARVAAGRVGAPLAGGRVPDPHRPVVRRRWPARCRPGRSPPPPPRCVVAGEGGALLAGGRVPDPHRPVAAAAGQPGAVRGDRHRPHRVGVAGEGGALLRRWPGPRSAPTRRRRRWPARCRPGRSPPPSPGRRGR